ncbi:MAG: sugar phosphate isomerase/epimerase [Kordiimonadaceae bacterium]|nr:sugar phosphate isomerase/epimerase [Kordiimonadaceae bacterium]
MNRRNFLKNTALLAGMIAFPASSALYASDRKLERIGIQLYTLRTLMKENVQDTLKMVADLGYHEVEFAGYFGKSPVELRQILDGEGLAAPSMHVGLMHIQTRLDQLIEAAHIVGHKYIVMPWLQQQDRETLDQFKDYAELFNKAGEKCQKAGISLAYHNHAFEFDILDGEEPYEVLLARTDPKLVKMQMDLYWAVKAGKDPIAYFKRFPGRFPLCHVKDMAADGSIVNVGHGTINFAKIFAQSDLAGIQHYFVENDHPQDARQAAAQSIETLKTLSF